MKSIFNAEAYQEILNRIETLSASSPRQWGKMSVAQMLCHCKMPVQLLLERIPAKGKRNWFFIFFFKRSLYNDRQWRKNVPTSKAFIVNREKNVGDEKKELLMLLNDLYMYRNRREWPKHPMLGKFTPEQYGKSVYKHLDHHLRQFNA
jgi:Protein of unknown function (DUF1569)